MPVPRVRIGKEDYLTLRVVRSCLAGPLFSKPSFRRSAGSYDPNAWISSCDATSYVSRSITGLVVDNDDLKCRIVVCEDRAHAGFDVSGFVSRRNDNADEGR